MRTRLKNIICATDFSEFSERGVYYGVSLAREFGAMFYLCHVIDLSSTAIYGETVLVDIDGQLNRISTYATNRLNRLIGEERIDWEPVISVGYPGDEITRIADEKNADLVITATHSRTGLKRLILGSVTLNLIRSLSCPILVVRGSASPKKPEIVPKKILVGCDFSDDSLLAFQHGINLAQEFQAELHLVHVIEPPVYENLIKPPKGADEFELDLRTKLRDQLAQMVPEEALHWCDLKSNLLAGQPHEELTKYAVVNEIDLIVIGVRGQGLLEKMLVGSTAIRVIRQAPCPVLVARVCPDMDTQGG
jgi:nucleotide-binding universal stress UspA family protein